MAAQSARDGRLPQCSIQSNITTSNKVVAGAVTKEFIQLGDDSVCHLSKPDEIIIYIRAFIVHFNSRPFYYGAD